MESHFGEHQPLSLGAGLPWLHSGKESACQCRTRDTGSIPGWGRSRGEGNGYPLQYSCLEKSMNRGAWRATVHGLAKSQTWVTNTLFSLNYYLSYLSCHRKLPEEYLLHSSLNFQSVAMWLLSLPSLEAVLFKVTLVPFTVKLYENIALLP